MIEGFYYNRVCFVYSELGVFFNYDWFDFEIDDDGFVFDF